MKQLIFIIFIILSISLLAQKDTARYKLNPNYTLQMGLYEIYKPLKADIVMLGDSRTHGCDWNSLLGRNNIAEMGITSDVIEGYLSRLNYVFRVSPKVVFIEGGINDIYNWTDVEKIYQQYTSLIRMIKSKGIIAVVQSTLLAAKKYPYAEGRNKEIIKLNKLLSEYCSKNNIEFINLNEKMTRNDFLIDDLTYDGVHLNGKGYKIWGSEVEKILNKLNL